MIPKFRAWVIELQKMYDVQAINYRCDRFYFDSHDDDIQDCAEDISRSFSVGFKDCELMQSTGLRDKNGVEIFAGDIVVLSRGVGVVETKIGHAPQVTYKNGNDLLRFVFDNLSVIGNIYANPELLEAQNEN